MSLFRAINIGLEQMLKYPDPIGDTLGKVVAAGLILYSIVLAAGLLR